MMLFKIVGSVFLLLAGGYVSVSVRRFERCRLRVLDGYVSLLYFIKGQIDCYAMPLQEIMARADPRMVADCLGLEPWGEELRGGVTLPAMISESRLYLEPECERLLMTFTGELGSVFRAEQVTRCDFYIQALTEERRKLCEAIPARMRTVSTLCLCCALGAAVLLW